MVEKTANTKDYVTTVTILENISDAIFILNPQGNIEYANKSALNLMRTESDKLLGQSIDNILMENVNGELGSDGKQKFDNLIDKFEDGIFENIEAAFVSEDKVIPVMLNFSVIADNNDKPKYIIVTAKDITHWKNLEKKMKQQQALSISKERLRLLGELSVGLIHTLTQPLLSLKMTLELFEKKLNNEEMTKQKMQKNVSGLLDLVDRMEKSVQNIRSYAQQTEDDTLAIININNIINKIKKRLVYELNDNKIDFNLDLEDNLPYFSANKLLIEQALISFIKNSIEAYRETQNSNDGRGKIRLETSAIKNKWIMVKISDDAGGIKKNIRSKVFDPFFTTKEVAKHSGVGLSIAKNVIGSIGGDIEMKVREGEGTDFNVKIPASKDDERAQLYNLIEMMNNE